MSVYLVKKKGWRYDFTMNRIRYTEGYFKTKKEVLNAEDKKKEAIRNPRIIQTGMDFLTLCNKRLDYMMVHISKKHYTDTKYYVVEWVKLWGKLQCDAITQVMLEDYLSKRSERSKTAANKEIRYLKSFFNFGIQRKLITANPAQDLEDFSVEKKPKYIPKKEDVIKLILAANPEDQNYIWAVKETMGRISEVNRLKWKDVDFEKREVTLYTRKKKHGNYTPRTIPMSDKLLDVLSRMVKVCENDIWVFTHRYWSKTDKCFKKGPYQYRKRLMKSLCQKAGIKPFGFHALRHFGASTLDEHNVPIKTIQDLLGHENRSTTEIYIHSISDSSKDAMRIFDVVNNEAFQKISHQFSHMKKVAVQGCTTEPLI